MSGLAAVLARHEAPGIHLWSGAFDVADVRHTVEHAGWGFGYVDGWTRADTKAAFLAEVGETLGFPDWYGQNFDALADCLGDVTAGDSEGWLLLWDGWGPLARHDVSPRGALVFGLVLGVVAPRGQLLALLRVVEVRQAGVVELQVVAAEIG